MPSVGVPRPNMQRVEGHIAQVWGGGDGIIRGAGSEASVSQTTPVSLSVLVGTCKGLIGGRLIEITSAITTSAITAPTGGSAGDLRRIDLVQFTYGTGVNIKAGTEASTPAAPDPDSNSIALADLYLRKGMSSIKTADDATNGYVVDRRTHV